MDSILRTGPDVVYWITFRDCLGCCSGNDRWREPFTLEHCLSYFCSHHHGCDCAKRYSRFLAYATSNAERHSETRNSNGVTLTARHLVENVAGVRRQSRPRHSSDQLIGTSHILLVAKKVLVERYVPCASLADQRHL